MDTSVLGKQVLPLPIDRSLLSGTECDKSGNGPYLQGEEKRLHYKAVVDAAQEEIDEDSLRMKWYVFSVCADNTYELRSDIGYSRKDTERHEFVLVPDGDTF